MNKYPQFDQITYDSLSINFQFSMVPTGTGKIGKMGRQFPVREFCQDWKSQGILLKIWKIRKKLYWKKYWKSLGKFVSQK